MRHATRLLKLEARTQHIADELDGPPSMQAKPFYVALAEYMDWLRSHLDNKECSQEDREYIHNSIAALQEMHGDWTVDQGWRHYYAGGPNQGDRCDHLEPLPNWQDLPLSQFRKFDDPKKRPNKRKTR
ncbi:MAG: hypothetical protein JWP89_1415 [Schlesneria sp.]|nr:hypothetical protein [Schlesneria sp.]